MSGSVALAEGVDLRGPVQPGYDAAALRGSTEEAQFRGASPVPLQGAPRKAG